MSCIYSYAGEAKTNRQSNDNVLMLQNLAVAVGLKFAKRLGLKYSYGEIIKRNADGLDGDFSCLRLRDGCGRHVIDNHEVGH